MTRSSRRRVAGCAMAVLGLLATAFASSSAPAAGSALKFSAPVHLSPWSGGEPSMAFSPNGRALYVTAPQHIPAGFNTVIDTVAGAPKGDHSGGDGVGFWASFNGGKSFPRNANIGVPSGGGDSDIAVGPDGTIYVADLELWASSICTSADGGASFTSRGLPARDTCQGLSFNHQGPESDRQWLNIAPDGSLYLTYHDFAFGFPIILHSTDKAGTFTPCGEMLDPQGPAGKNYLPQNGTLVAKPVVGKDGSIYATITEPDQVAPPVGAKLNHAYMAVSSGPCSPTSVFKNYTIYEDPGADFKLFQSLGIDGGGTLYAVAAGLTKAGQTNNNIWLFASKDHGQTWTKPIQVNAPNVKGNVMAAVVGGLGSNQVAIGWFGTKSSGDPNNTKNQWRYYVATSIDGGKTFSRATITATPIHYGDICTQGLYCGIVPGPSNRNLADFSSIAVNPVTGCVAVAFPGDPYNRPDISSKQDNGDSSAYVATQTGGTCLSKQISKRR